jgi:hypothetical protein
MNAQRRRKPTTQSNQGVELDRRDRLMHRTPEREGVEGQEDRPDDGADQVDHDRSDDEDEGVEG